MRSIPAWHLPEDVELAPVRTLVERADVRITTPSLDPARIDAVCSRLIEGRERMLAMPVARVIAAIDIAASRLLLPDEPLRGQVLLSLEAITGFSPQMATLVLDRAVADWRAPALEQLVRDELGGPAAIESFTDRATPGHRARVIASPLGVHIFAGNVPGVGVTSLIRALLVRSAVLGKPAMAEPVLTAAFARLVAQADPELGRCIAVAWWQGGDPAIEDAALARAGLVVHYGGADAIESLRARAPAHVKFLEHGPRISFALVNAARVDQPRTAADLARAVALFDQQGCVSPQLAYVMGTHEQARDVAAATADALDHLQLELPRGRIDAAEAAAIHDMRARAEFAAIAGRRTAVWAGSDLSWSVILSDESAFEGSCLNRTLLIKAVPDLAALLAAIAPFGSVLQTVGIAGFDGDERAGVAAALAAAGATRITSLPDMPWPPPGWHHDGRGPLQELVRWVDLES